MKSTDGVLYNNLPNYILVILRQSSITSVQQCYMQQIAFNHYRTELKLHLTLHATKLRDKKLIYENKGEQTKNSMLLVLYFLIWR